MMAVFFIFVKLNVVDCLNLIVFFVQGLLVGAGMEDLTFVGQTRKEFVRCLARQLAVGDISGIFNIHC